MENVTKIAPIKSFIMVTALRVHTPSKESHKYGKIFENLGNHTPAPRFTLLKTNHDHFNDITSIMMLTSGKLTMNVKEHLITSTVGSKTI